MSAADIRELRTYRVRYEYRGRVTNCQISAFSLTEAREFCERTIAPGETVKVERVPLSDSHMIAVRRSA